MAVDQIQLRRDTAADWLAANPTLAEGEPGLETDTGKIKYGDGLLPWDLLPYFTTSGETDLSDYETTTQLDSRDSNNRNRSNHTGTQPASTISDFAAQVALVGAVATNTAKVGVTDQTNDDTIDTHKLDLANPHAVTKEQIGLANVPNTNFTSAVAANTAKISFDSSASAKLAGIAVGATVDQTGAEIVTAINTELGSSDWQTQKTQEQIEDIVAAMLQAGTHTNLTVTYDDASGSLSLSATGGGGGGTLTDEQVQDIVGAFSASGTGINVDYDDASDSMTFSLTGESFTTAYKNRVDAITDAAYKNSNTTKSDVGLSNVPNTDFTSAVAANTAKVGVSDETNDDTVNTHIADTANPHAVTKAQVGLTNVPNTDFTAAVAANTAKETNATHTGDVAGSDVLTISDGAVTPGKWTNPHCWRVSRGSSQLIPNVTSTKLQLDSIRLNPSGNYSAANHRFTATVAGYYQVGACMRYDSISSGTDTYIYVRVNGSNVASGMTEMGGTGESAVQVDDLVYLDVGDYAEIYVYHNNGNSRNTKAGSTWTYSWGSLVHAT